MEDKFDKVLKYIIIVFLIVVFFSMPIYIVTESIVSKKEYNALYIKYRDIREEYAKEYTEIETAWEFMSDYYDDKIKEQNKTIEYLTDTIDSIVGTNKREPHTQEYIQQMRDDFEAYVNHIFNYYEHGFHDNNPDISIVDYIAMKDYELLIRLGEY